MNTKFLIEIILGKKKKKGLKFTLGWLEENVDP